MLPCREARQRPKVCLPACLPDVPPCPTVVPSGPGRGKRLGYSHLQVANELPDGDLFSNPRIESLAVEHHALQDGQGPLQDGDVHRGLTHVACNLGGVCVCRSSRSVTQHKVCPGPLATQLGLLTCHPARSYLLDKGDGDHIPADDAMVHELKKGCEGECQHLTVATTKRGLRKSCLSSRRPSAMGTTDPISSPLSLSRL